MGQYFKIINVDKKEQIKPNDFDNLRKLMEFSYEGNEFVTTLYQLLETSWKGDRVYVTGDYDDEINIYGKDKSYYDTYLQLEKEFEAESLYHLSDNWKRLQKKDIKNTSKDKDYIRIYNTETKEYINLKTLPIEWIFEGCVDKETGKFYKPHAVSVTPLTLLITFGNGAGGSFYSNDEYKMSLVGSWCKYTKGIVVSKDIIPEYEDTFTELKPDFTEKNKILSYEEGIKKVKELNEKWDFRVKNSKTFSQKEVDSIREKYPAGTRIKLIKMYDLINPVPLGTEGVVTNVDDVGTIHMNWKTGSSLGLIAGVDEFKVICPNCGNTIEGYPAISRKDNKTEICSKCGTTEALEEFENGNR